MEKIALVTGSTNNIGKAVAETLSKEKYHVIITSRHGDEAREVSHRLPQKGSFFQVDFSKVEEIQRLFDFIKETFSRLDVLVNNVAYTKNESILDCDLETWQYTLDTNLRSTYLCSRYAAELMKVSGGGNIVNITVSGPPAAKNKFSYTVSKGGINSLTLSAAVDLAPYNIRVNAIGSGPVGTPLGHRDYAGRQFKNDKIPIGHIGSPEDIGEAVAFLVSEKAKHILGAILSVDGGFQVSH